MSLEKSPHYYYQCIEPSRITFARELKGLTKKQLAEIINKTPSAITQYENGTSNLAFETFITITQALDIRPSFLSNEAQTLPTCSIVSCHFRANKRVPQIEKVQALTYAKLVNALFSFLETQGIVFPDVDLPVRTSNRISLKEIEHIAQEVRKTIGLGLAPITNIAEVLEGLGIRIVLLPTQCARLDAFATWFDGKPCIMIAKDSPASRMQFDYAHEFAHLLFDEDNSPDDNLLEMRANKFASAFLMPEPTFRVDCPKTYRKSLFLSVKQHWNVSIAAALYRAKELNIMTEQAYKNAQIHRSINGERINEEGEFPKSLPSFLNQAMQLIHEEFTVDDIAVQIGIAPNVLIEILEFQNVSPEIIALMTPKKHKAQVIDFVSRTKIT